MDDTLNNLITARMKAEELGNRREATKLARKIEERRTILYGQGGSQKRRQVVSKPVELTKEDREEQAIRDELKAARQQNDQKRAKVAQTKLQQFLRKRRR